jgi:hypothetical protein
MLPRAARSADARSGTRADVERPLTGARREPLDQRVVHVVDHVGDLLERRRPLHTPACLAFSSSNGIEPPSFDVESILLG